MGDKCTTARAPAPSGGVDGEANAVLAIERRGLGIVVDNRDAHVGEALVQLAQGPAGAHVPLEATEAQQVDDVVDALFIEEGELIEVAHVVTREKHGVGHDGLASERLEHLDEWSFMKGSNTMSGLPMMPMRGRGFS